LLDEIFKIHKRKALFCKIIDLSKKRAMPYYGELYSYALRHTTTNATTSTLCKVTNLVCNILLCLYHY